MDEQTRKDLDRVEFDADDIKKALRRPDSFGMFSSADHYEDMFKTWSLGPVILTRDSEALERSNAFVLKRELAKFPEWAEQWYIFDANHWAVGWVEHLSFQVIDEKGEPTDVAKWIKSWFDSLSDYPVADEFHFSELEETERYEWYTSSAAQRTVRAHVKTLKHEFELSKPTVKWLKAHPEVGYRIVGENDSDAIYHEDWRGTSDYFTRDEFAKMLRDHHKWAYEEKMKNRNEPRQE